ncbi:MAG: hypothetical protein HBSAPP02_31000 [Phycisphaerae bacterium]|nr:MAG: hypothetical protein HBSAPP02_31000 [Phycisphaerae bacterium]
MKAATCRWGERRQLQPDCDARAAVPGRRGLTPTVALHPDASAVLVPDGFCGHADWADYSVGSASLPHNLGVFSILGSTKRALAVSHDIVFFRVP